MHLKVYIEIKPFGTYKEGTQLSPAAMSRIASKDKARAESSSTESSERLRNQKP